MLVLAFISSADYTLRPSRRNRFTRSSSVGTACTWPRLTVKVLSMRLGICLVSLLLATCCSLALAQQRPAGGTARTITIVSEPSAVVWIDEIRRGTTDLAGKLAQVKVSSGAHTLRVRANGFREITMPLTAAQRGEIRVRLLRT